MATMVIFRTKFSNVQTIGLGFVYDESGQIMFTFRTLEREWNNNKIGASCVPEGVYKVDKRYSLKFGNHFILHDTEPRSYILIHAGNFNFQTNGCVLVGNEHNFLDSDLNLDITDSRKTLDKLLQILPQKFNLKIISYNGTSKL